MMLFCTAFNLIATHLTLFTHSFFTHPLHTYSPSFNYSPSSQLQTLHYSLSPSAQFHQHCNSSPSPLNPSTYSPFLTDPLTYPICPPSPLTYHTLTPPSIHTLFSHSLTPHLYTLPLFTHSFPIHSPSSTHSLSPHSVHSNLTHFD